MKKLFRDDKRLGIMLTALLAVLFAGICLVNFSTFSGWYDSDMYLDILYASRAWKEKTIFPEGWIFGNQFYAVSTPVIAAVFCGFLEPQTAMAAASVAVTLLIVVSFLWMLAPAVRSWEARLAGAVVFVLLPLFCGDAWHDVNGWQLLFTMCSYYGIYAATAFLAFGCYLRAEKLSRKDIRLLLVLTCALSFGTGMQSLRQTAVMTCPMIGMELLRLIYCGIRKEKPEKNPAIIAGLITVCNVLGLVVIRMLDVSNQGVRAKFVLPSLSEILSNIPVQLQQAFKLFGLSGQKEVMIFGLMLVLCMIAAVAIILKSIRQKEGKTLAILILFGIGIAAVFGAGVLKVLQIRQIYYFMLYPMIGFLLACFYGDFGRTGKAAVLLVIALLAVSSAPDFWEDVVEPIRQHEKAPYVEVADYLVENGYTTLYTEWDNYGEDVAVAAGCQVRVGYWGWEYTPFESIRYLCDPGIYSESVETSAYLFRGTDRVELAVNAARELGVELELIAWFPDGDFYLYSAPVNLMALH